MSFFEAIILGLIQGLTEFLPISSSGHLVILSNVLGVNEQGILFEVFVHFGTLLAVFVVFKDDIIKLIKNPFQKLTILLIIGTIPTAIIGLTLEDTFERLFNSLFTVGFTLLITGTLLWLAESFTGGKKDLSKLTGINAFIIGIAQGAAITPGISRSGSTIAAALLLGLDRSSAARYSFLLSIPAILGATVLKTKDLIVGIGEVRLLPLMAGTVMAALSGYFAIKFLLKILEQGKLKYFSVYCWLLGGIIIFYHII